jgi:hypothetical protein
MPRLPVDGKKVIEHRFSMGQFERDQLDTLITGMTVKNVSTPLVALLSDVTAMLTIAGILEALGLIDLSGIIGRLGDEFKQWVDDTKAGLFETPQAAEDAFNIIAEAKDIAYGPEVGGYQTGIIGSYLQYQLTSTEKIALWAYTTLGNIPGIPWASGPEVA